MKNELVSAKSNTKRDGTTDHDEAYHTKMRGNEMVSKP